MFNFVTTSCSQRCDNGALCLCVKKMRYSGGALTRSPRSINSYLLSYLTHSSNGWLAGCGVESKSSLDCLFHSCRWRSKIQAVSYKCQRRTYTRRIPQHSPPPLWRLPQLDNNRVVSLCWRRWGGTKVLHDERFLDLMPATLCITVSHMPCAAIANCLSIMWKRRTNPYGNFIVLARFVTDTSVILST